MKNIIKVVPSLLAAVLACAVTPASAYAASWDVAGAYGFTVDANDYTDLWTTASALPVYQYAYDKYSGDLAGTATINWFCAKQIQQTNGYDFNAVMFYVTMTPQANFRSHVGSLGLRAVTGASDDFEITMPFSSMQLYQVSYPDITLINSDMYSLGAGISATTSINLSNLNIINLSKASGIGNKFQLCYDYVANPGGNVTGNVYLMNASDQRALVYYATNSSGDALSITSRARFGALWGAMSYCNVAEDIVTWNFSTVHPP